MTEQEIKEVARKGVMQFVDATNSQTDGYGYQAMLTHLFSVFACDHGTNAAVLTILDALKPLMLQFYEPEKLQEKFDRIMDEVFENERMN